MTEYPVLLTQYIHGFRLSIETPGGRVYQGDPVGTITAPTVRAAALIASRLMRDAIRGHAPQEGD